MKTKFIILLFVPFIAQASIYNETKVLPDECYSSSNYTPDSLMVMPKCFAISDYEAHRKLKTQQEYFKKYAPGCSNLKIGTYNSIVCSSAYSNYVNFYYETDVMSKLN